MSKTVDITILLTAYNEEACLTEVLHEAADVLAELNESSELLVVDDGSTDATPQVLTDLQTRLPTLRVLALTPNSGKTVALGAGFKHCRGRTIVMMDADGQNNPHDIPKLLAELKTCDVCCGYRYNRQDTWSKRWGSRLANRVRQSILKDGIRDTGCGLKAVRSEFVQVLPMSLRGMHRFLPALWQMHGAQIKQIPVDDRPRAAGKSKYTNAKRLRATIWDLWAVRWMQQRHRMCNTTERGQPCFETS